MRFRNLLLAIATLIGVVTGLAAATDVNPGTPPLDVYVITAVSADGNMW